MFGFSLVWLGQIVSVMATNMSAFVLSIWVFEKTQSATSLALVQVFFITPYILITPIAGVMVDRHNRKTMMMVSDLSAGLATVAILVLQAFGMLQVWHLYAAAILQGLGNAFQWPAYSAAISTMLPKEQYARANGMMSLIEAGPGVLAPALAGALLPIIGLSGILSIDVITFVFAVGVLAFVFIPQPKQSQDGAQAQGNLLQEAAFGFRYIFARPSLLGLQMIFFFGNLFTGIAFTVMTPMILSRTANDSAGLGLVMSAGAIGGVVGGVIMSAWGGFKRRVNGVLLGWGISCIFFALVGVGTAVPFWIVMNALSSLVNPLINASNQAIWQAKVAPDVQGRVFSARTIIAWFTNPISPIIGGMMADYVLEPAMRTGGSLTSVFGRLVPPGPGAGMALLIVFGALAASIVGWGGYFIPVIRNAEELLPDHDHEAPSPAV
jgi:MFS family permease